MAKTAAFDENIARYDQWFAAHASDFHAEVAALRPLLPSGDLLEVGIGTGQFAAALGVPQGIEPSLVAAAVARGRGLSVWEGVAERIPREDALYDGVLLVTALCFVDDLARTFSEAARVLRPGGRLVLGYVDADGPLGTEYVEKSRNNPFYREATFYGTADLVERLTQAGWSDFRATQTLFPEGVRYRVEAGSGVGGFVALSALRPQNLQVSNGQNQSEP